MDVNLIYLVNGISSSLIILNKQKQKKKWVKKKWLLKRKERGDIALLKELTNLPDDYRNFLRMDEDLYCYLLQLVTPYIERKDTIMRTCITPHERLSATLRYLATGRSYEDMKFSTRISASSLSRLVPETCRAIYLALKEEYFKFPDSEKCWEEIAKEFFYKWNFPNCLGAIDGKHVAIVRPHNSGAYFYNYKGFYSIVLMAIVNANYEFVYCNVGTNGRVSDGGVIEYTDFNDDLVNNRLKIPASNYPKNYDLKLPYVFVSDEAFRLTKQMIKPFSKQNLNSEREYFNRRLSRSRQVVENAFGILASRFRIFHTKINLALESTDIVVLAACALHNYLRRKNQNYIELSDIHVKNDNLSLDGLNAVHNQRGNEDGKAVRELFLDYFIQTKN